MLRTVLRTIYILTAAGIVFAGLYWYADASEYPAVITEPLPGEERGSGQGLGTGVSKNKYREIQANSDQLPAGKENLEMGHDAEHLSGGPAVLIFIRNIVLVLVTVILVLLLQSGWKRLVRRKAKA